MATPDRRRLLIPLIAGVALVLTIPLWGSYLGRAIPWLEVRRVEISGTRLIAPHQILRASGIRQGQNIFDDPTVWEDALRQHPVVGDVTISRRPPGTLRIRVREKAPIALVEGEALEFVTADGDILPIDPSAAPLDLPIVRGALTEVDQADRVRRALAETARIAAIAPRLIAEVSEIGPAPEHPDLLLLVHPVADILLPIGASDARLAQLRAVLADLARQQSSIDGSSAFSRRPSLDLRYDSQAVVRHPSPRELS